MPGRKKPLFDEPSEIDAVEGEVHVERPDNVDVALTPEAAVETSDRLLRGAFKAGGQRRLKNFPHKAKR
jgi:hypothetical protein